MITIILSTWWTLGSSNVSLRTVTMKLLLLIFFFCGTLWSTKGANILFVGSMPAHSHFTLTFRLAKEMADRGHQVTVINPYPQKTPIANYTDVPVLETIQRSEEYRNNMFERINVGIVKSMQQIYEIGCSMTELTFQNENVQKLLNSNATFDVVIVEFFLNEALVGLSHHFKAPLIILSPVGSSALTNYIFANPAPSSYVPNLGGAFTKHMNFVQRLLNLLMNCVFDVIREFYYLPKQRTLFKKYIKSDLELDDILHNTSIMLTNSHVSINNAVPHIPSIIEIGGYHVSPPKKLPEDLQTFLDNAAEGVILFSMGSNLRSKDLKPEIRKSLLNAFGKIKQQVLWKFEADLPEAPKNVKIEKWLPQQDILAHPNVKAFISHGGLLSTIETVYHGVPIIGIPVFGDQKSNVAAAVSNGYALALPLDEITEEKMTSALNEIINNPKYRENVQQRSKLMRDQPLKPIDTAVYWVEHVIHHKGAPHLRSAGIDLNWYQREMIDVLGFIALVLTVTVTTFYLVLKKIVNLFCQKKSKKVTKVKKN